MSLRRIAEELDKTAPKVMDAARLIGDQIKEDKSGHEDVFKNTVQLRKDAEELFADGDDYLASLSPEERARVLDYAGNAFLLGALGATAVQTESL